MHYCILYLRICRFYIILSFIFSFVFISLLSFLTSFCVCSLICSFFALHILVRFFIQCHLFQKMIRKYTKRVKCSKVNFLKYITENFVSKQIYFLYPLHPIEWRDVTFFRRSLRNVTTVIVHTCLICILENIKCMRFN